MLDITMVSESCNGWIAICDDDCSGSEARSNTNRTMMNDQPVAKGIVQYTVM